jgi:hypothetical protein
MIIKQYVITLPADYDMGIIRERVATRGPAFDSLAGLGLKCFLIREKNRCGAESNQYAPVYLWPEVESLWGFVAGKGFAGILDAFGWRHIEFWPGVAYARAPGSDLKSIRSVTREGLVLSPGTDLERVYRAEIAGARERVSATPGLLAYAVGLNPETWSLVRLSYWQLPQSELPASAHSYEVLHVSAPHAEALRVS